MSIKSNKSLKTKVSKELECDQEEDVDCQEEKLLVSEEPQNLYVDELPGGLRQKIKIPWFYPPKFYNQEQIAELLTRSCLSTKYVYSDFTQLGGPRRHSRINLRDKVIYFPSLIEKVRLPSKCGTHLWQLFAKNVKPDKNFIEYLQDSLQMALSRLKHDGKPMESFILSDTLVNFNWLTHSMKHDTIKTMFCYLRSQHELKNVILENALLTPEDGLRFLYIFAYTCAETIISLNLCYFFKYGFLPVKNHDFEKSVYDPFEFDVVIDTIPPDQRQKDLLWKKYIIHSMDQPESLDNLCYLFKVCLNLFTSLEAIHLQYSYLAEGQGKVLCQIGAVLNGNLKELHIICTPYDLPKITNQLITHDAWEKTLSFCPGLKLFFMLSNVPFYNDIKCMLFPIMPLRGLYMDTGLPYECDSTSNWYLGCTITTLASYYAFKLRKLSLHFWYANELLDISISKCLTHLYFLQEFEYRGPFDKLDTVIEICEFVLNEDALRLRLLHIYVLEDACYCEMYKTAIKELYDKYKGPFLANDIDFLLETCCI